MSRQELTELRNDQLRFKEFAQAAFKAFDINGDGFINMDELANFLEHAAMDLGKSLAEGSVEEVMDFLTTNSPDRLINFGQFSQFLDQVLEAVIKEGDIEDEDENEKKP